MVTPCGIKWVTPPSHQSRDSENASLRYQMVLDIYNTTQPVMYEDDNEPSIFCLLTTVEPASVDQALREECW